MSFNWINNNRWDSILILLNEKRVAKGFSTISHTFSDWVKQSDIDTLRNGLIEILSSYGYTLSTALHAAGYLYDTWKTWIYNWIAEVSLDEIEDILNILISGVSQISVHVHSPEGKEIGSVLVQDGWANLVDIYVDNVYKEHGSDNASNHPRLIEVTSGDIEVKVTFNGMESIQNVHVNEGEILIVTFTFTRIETFDLISWLDDCNINNDCEFEFNLDLANPPPKIYQHCEPEFPFYLLCNDFGHVTFNSYGRNYNPNGSVSTSATGTSHCEFTSSIFKRNLFCNFTKSGLGSANFNFGAYWGTSGSVIHYVSISEQSFDNWFIGNKNHYHYPGLAFWRGGDINLYDKIVSFNDKIDKEIYLYNAKSPYIAIRQFPPGGGISQVSRSWTLSDSYSFEDSNGVLDSLFCSSIPYDLTGLAV